MLSKLKPLFIIPIALLLLFGAQLACNLSSSDDQSATVEALAESISLTATAGFSEELGAADALKTAQALATAEAQSAAETQDAQANLSDEALAATATAIAPILKELPKYDVDPEEGRVAWIYPPTTLEVEEYMSNDFENRYLFTTIKDFAISSDITWNTQYGTSGCGYVMRSDGKEENGNNYMLILSRVAEGHVVFITTANGDLAGMEDLYVPMNDPDFSWDNDTTNRLTVVGRENIFTVYTNGNLIGEFIAGEPPPQPIMPTPPPKPEGPLVGDALERYNNAMEKYEEEVEEAQASYQAQLRVFEENDTDFREGFVTLGAINESGHTICHFDNSWLFLIEEE